MSQMRAVPALFTTSPARILIKVDLPAPFGPSNPNIEPRGMLRSTVSRAGRGAAALLRGL
jgi:hypothetical protein